MAGVDPEGAFDADGFREGIRSAMLMGLPQDESLRPRFKFPVTTVNASADPGNRPFDFNQPKDPSSQEPAEPLLVLCGIEVEDEQRAYTNAGKFEARRAVLTFFEDEWVAVNEPVPFHQVLIGAKPYRRGATLEPAGLFEVTIQRVEVIAEDI